MGEGPCGLCSPAGFQKCFLFALSTPSTIPRYAPPSKDGRVTFGVHLCRVSSSHPDIHICTKRGKGDYQLSSGTDYRPQPEVCAYGLGSGPFLPSLYLLNYGSTARRVRIEGGRQSSRTLITIKLLSPFAVTISCRAVQAIQGGRWESNVERPGSAFGGGVFGQSYKTHGAIFGVISAPVRANPYETAQLTQHTKDTRFRRQ